MLKAILERNLFSQSTLICGLSIWMDLNAFLLSRYLSLTGFAGLFFEPSGNLQSPLIGKTMV